MADLADKWQAWIENKEATIEQNLDYHSRKQFTNISADRVKRPRQTLDSEKFIVLECYPALMTVNDARRAVGIIWGVIDPS